MWQLCLWTGDSNGLSNAQLDTGRRSQGREPHGSSACRERKGFEYQRTSMSQAVLLASAESVVVERWRRWSWDRLGSARLGSERRALTGHCRVATGSVWLAAGCIASCNRRVGREVGRDAAYAATPCDHVT